MRNAETRSALFWGYADIEAYGISSSLLEWEGATAHPMHVEKVRVFHKSIAEKYENAKDTYTFIDKKERRRAFSNWCNRSMSLQAQDCGPSFQRLYELVYRQMSAYIHGTAWSLRRQVSYSRDHYDLKVILNDVASIIRTTTAVWAEWAKFCIEVLDWKLSETIPEFIARLEDLERKHFL